MTPLVSVILPTYNRPQFLARALYCIMAQKYDDFEVVVVNDAGEDVSELVGAFPKTSYLAHETNRGLSAARNTGIKVARGKYITYMDDDDILFPEHLSTLVGGLEGTPDAHAAFTDCYRWYDEHYLVGARKKPTGKPQTVRRWHLPIS